MTISEVSERYGLSADTLRYYEKIGLIPRVARKENGVRDYQPQDCQLIEFIKCMRGTGMPVEALIEYFALLRQGAETTPQRRQMLADQRQALLKKRQELEKTLERLDQKISFYDQEIQKNVCMGKDETGS